MMRCGPSTLTKRTELSTLPSQSYSAAGRCRKLNACRLKAIIRQWFGWVPALGGLSVRTRTNSPAQLLDLSAIRNLALEQGTAVHLAASFPKESSELYIGPSTTLVAT